MNFPLRIFKENGHTMQQKKKSNKKIMCHDIFTTLYRICSFVTLKLTNEAFCTLLYTRIKLFPLTNLYSLY